MADAVVSRLGQVNQAGDVKALFEKRFMGEVLVTFNERDVFMNRHFVRTITNGKSASFPVMGDANAAYHTPGAQLLGGKVNHGERIITIDDLLVSDLFIANIDEAMNHWDVRSRYSRKMGVALSNKFSRNVAAVTALAARASGAVTEENGGTELVNANMATDASVIAQSCFDSMQALDEKDVEYDTVWGYFRPAQYYLLAQDTNLINKDWDGKGSYAAGNIYGIGGVVLVKSNQVPGTDLTADTTVSPSARADFSNTVGIISTEDAVGTVKLLDLALESEYQISRQGTLMVGKYAVGHGILRPSAAVELRTA